MPHKTMTVSADIGITEQHRQAIAVELNKLLADEFLLYTKTRKFHWNVEGMHFHDLHLFFEKQYEELAVIVDEIAERIRKLGHYALGAMSQFLEETRLLEHTDEATDAHIMVQALLDDHETLIRMLRKDIPSFEEKHKDAGTGDFANGLMKKHERMAWMLRALIS